jgi:hypothetical protein
MADNFHRNDAAVRLGIELVRDLKGATDEVLRSQFITDRLAQKGQISFNNSGDGIRWRVHYRRATPEEITGTEPIIPEAQDRFREAFLDYGAMRVADAMSKREYLKNQGGSSTLIKYFANMSRYLKADMKEAFALSLYQKGTNPQSSLYGLDSLFDHTQTIDTTATTTTPRTANADDMFGYPAGTYAGLSTQLGAEGGSWSGVWPDGTGNAQFHYFSPFIVNSTSRKFHTSQQLSDTLTKALRKGLAASRIVKSADGPVDYVIGSHGGFYAFANAMDSREQLWVKTSEQAASYGFTEREGRRFDGAVITWEYGVPDNTSPGVSGQTAQFYGVNLNCIHFHSMQEDLFGVSGPKWDDKDYHFYVIVDLFGQWRFTSPRNFIKWLSIK